MGAIIGLDVATKTGACVMEGDKLIHWEAFRPKGDGDAAIFHGYRSWLWGMLTAFDIQHGAMEQPLVTNLSVTSAKSDLAGASVSKRNPVTMKTYLRLYGLYAHTVEIFHARNINLEIVHQGTWRKAFLGTGHGDKDMALARCKVLGYEITSKDAAEAAGVASWLQGYLSPLSVLIRESALLKGMGATE